MTHNRGAWAHRRRTGLGERKPEPFLDLFAPGQGFTKQHLSVSLPRNQDDPCWGIENIMSATGKGSRMSFPSQQ